MGMDVDAVFAKKYLDKIKKIVSDQEHGKREGICDDIIEFHEKMEKKWGEKESTIPETTLSPDSMKEFFEKMGMNEKWVYIENPDEVLMEIYLSDLSPFKTSMSLHIIEERYLINEVTYRIISSIGTNSKPSVEKLIT